MLMTFEGMETEQLEWIGHEKTHHKAFAGLTELEQRNLEASRVTLRLNWPSCNLTMALFGESNVPMDLYRENTPRHGSTLTAMYSDWLQRQFLTWDPLLGNIPWLTEHGFC